ncbi:MAG: acyl carrier protein [Acidobacteriia bacterium]|nr:acyl carrier protein [Terriglobia bacterium]
MQAIAQELRNFVVNNFLFGQNEKLRNDDSFFDNGIIDSTGILELVGFLHERFGVHVEDQELIPENLDSIDRLVAYLQAKLRENGQASASVH